MWASCRRITVLKNTSEGRTHTATLLYYVHRTRRQQTEAVCSGPCRSAKRDPEATSSGSDLTHISCRGWLISILSLFTAGSAGPLDASASLPRSLITSVKDASTRHREGGADLASQTIPMDFCCFYFINVSYILPSRQQKSTNIKNIIFIFTFLSVENYLQKLRQDTTLHCTMGIL